MQKKILVLMMALLLVVLCACGGGNKPDNGGDTYNHKHCACVNLSANVGDHACAEAGWMEVGTADAFNAAIADLSTGVNIVLTADIAIADYVTVPQGGSLGICLNGKTLNASIKNLGKLDITDCSHNEGAFAGTLTTNKVTAIDNLAGATCNIYGGNITSTMDLATLHIVKLNGAANEELQLEKNTATVNLYNGKIFTDKTADENGACMYIEETGVINMYGGLVTGAKVECITTGNTRYGANICVWGYDAVLNMFGGTVSNGSCKVLGQDGQTAGAWGGNIGTYRGQLNIWGGTVTGGYSNGYGGNIGLGATALGLSIKNATISNGEAAGNFGGNIYVNSSRAVVEITDNAVLTGGKCINFGGNLYLNNYTSASFSNCTFSEGKAPNGGSAFSGKGNLAAITLGANVIFSNNQTSDIVTRGDNMLNVENFTTTGKVIVNCEGVGPKTLTADVPNGDLFQAAEGYVLGSDGGKITVALAG